MYNVDHKPILRCRFAHHDVASQTLSCKMLTKICFVMVALASIEMITREF